MASPPLPSCRARYQCPPSGGGGNPVRALARPSRRSQALLGGGSPAASRSLRPRTVRARTRSAPLCSALSTVWVTPRGFACRSLSMPCLLLFDFLLFLSSLVPRLAAARHRIHPIWTTRLQTQVLFSGLGIPGTLVFTGSGTYVRSIFQGLGPARSCVGNRV